MGVRALPKAPSVRPPPPVRRPLPRARPVTPSAALVKPAVIAPSVAAPSPEAHKRTPTGTLLGVATIPEAKLPIEGEGATRIEASPFDRSAVPSPVTLELTPVPDQTAPTERFEEPPTDVSIRRPAPNIEEDLTDVRRQRSSSDEGPTHVQQPSPFARNDGKLPSRPSLPSRRDGQPMPLPPPPRGAAPHVRVDPPEGPTDVAVKLPVARNSDAHVDVPVDPRRSTAALLPVAPDGAPPPVSSPMPPVPAAGLVAALKYLWPLADAILDRYLAQMKLRSQLHDDQRVVDEVLHRLGEAAWKDPSRPAELRDELLRADEDEQKRRGAENDVARLDMSMATERDRFSEDEHRRKNEIAAHEAESVRLTEDLRERERAQKTEERTLKEVDARYAAVKKRLDQLSQKAAKAEVTPPEKGGGPNAAANYRREAQAVQVEVDGFLPERQAAEAKVRALDEPIATLEQRLTDERAALEAAKAELAAARQDTSATLDGLAKDRVAQETVRVTAEKNIRLRLVSTGTLLSLHRLEGNDRKAVFGPIYEQLDELQAITQAREQQIAHLEEERNGFDRAAVQRGLIVVGSVLGAVVILLVVLLVVLARRH